VFLTYNGRRFELGGRSRVTIGRRPTCDVALAGDDEVSRLHAELIRLGDDWVVHDDGLSRNGTFVNGERVRGRRRLSVGDVIAVGTTSITVGGAANGSGSTRRAAPSAPPVALTPAQRRLLEVLCTPLRESPYAAPASNKRIADELVLSVETVKGSLSALYELFGLSELPQNEKRAALAVRALDQL